MDEPQNNDCFKHYDSRPEEVTKAEEYIANSPFKKSINKKIDSDSEHELGKMTQNDTSISSDGSESENSRKMKKKYDVDYKVFSRSKSTSGLYRHNKESLFPTVKEEKCEEETDIKLEDNNYRKFKQLNLKIQNEGYDNIEEILIEGKPRKYTRSTKCLSLMDPVLEVKEDIDFNQIKFAPFKKLKYITDVEEDIKIRSSTKDHYNRFDVEEAIAEDNRENDIDLDTKKKYHTYNIKKIPEFIDKSDKIDEQYAPQNIITEEIKEDPEHEENPEELITNHKIKLISSDPFDKVDELNCSIGNMNKFSTAGIEDLDRIIESEDEGEDIFNENRDSQ